MPKSNYVYCGFVERVTDRFLRSGQHSVRKGTLDGCQRRLIGRRVVVSLLKLGTHEVYLMVHQAQEPNHFELLVSLTLNTDSQEVCPEVTPGS